MPRIAFEALNCAARALAAWAYTSFRDITLDGFLMLVNTAS